MSAPSWGPPVAAGPTRDVRDIVTLAARACARDPEVPAIVFEDGATITRGELRLAVESFGGWLSERIEPGDRVAIMLENRIEFMVAWLATAAAGGVLVSVNHGSGEHDAGHVLRDSGAVVAIAGESTRALVERLQPSCPQLAHVVTVGDCEPHGLALYKGAEPLDLDAASVDPSAVTNVYYTSGTTGPPKGCMLAHDYWLRFVDLYQRLYGLRREDRLLCCLQFFYGDPPWMMLLSLHAGTTLVAMRRFSVSRFWNVVRSNRVTQLFAVASIPSLLLKAPPDPRDCDHEMRFALQIGVPANLHAAMNERWGFPWVEGYGLTETGLVIGMPLAEERGMTGSGSIGVPCPETEVRLIDEGGAEVPTGESGEITLRAPGLMRGYLGRPEATAETMRDGWLHTGDLARADERGFLFFQGRRKDIIRRGGENIAASEVEEVIRAHPSVEEVAVVPVPDDLHGEEVKAHVALVEGTSLSAGEIVAYCSGRLARHKLPRYVELRDRPFPRTPSMRVRKGELIAEDPDPAGSSWDRERELDPHSPEETKA
ncbi:MAG TPA: AMP-binding protein [Solirubrobacterales bacterium]|nr:AMP-binding protein [Solirubrobacterales bacterium]